jgi:2-polyprenyl-3-methyl-5-hydroxy-6-metoxy-1,4-benzoquinol methylase
VLDVGCADGALFRLGQARIASGVGIDIRESDTWAGDGYERRVGTFPDALRPDERFDAVVMLAVVEHLPDQELARWAAAVPPILQPNGRVVITTPSPAVDHILHAGIRLKVIDGMEADEHHGFDPGDVPAIFSRAGLRLERRRRFELGLNHLFVFSATPA